MNIFIFINSKDVIIYENLFEVKIIIGYKKEILIDYFKTCYEIKKNY